MTRSQATTTTGTARFWTGWLAGVVTALVLVAVGYEASRLLRPDRWTDVAADWRLLPSQARAGALPQTFAVPAKPWDYAATTRALPLGVTALPSIVRVDVSDVSGPVGLSLAKPDGSALISKEKPLATGAKPTSVYFRSDGSQPVAVLVRNYDGKGAAGAVRVRSLKVVPIGRLPQRALEKIAAAGLN